MVVTERFDCDVNFAKNEENEERGAGFVAYGVTVGGGGRGVMELLNQLPDIALPSDSLPDVVE